MRLDERVVLAAAAIGLLPIALSYGVAPQQSVPVLLGIPVEQVNLAHVFRAIMGLYLANALFWMLAVFRPQLRAAALWVLMLFMGGLALGRVLSLVTDGMPSLILLFYLGAELVFASAALLLLMRKGD